MTEPIDKSARARTSRRDFLRTTGALAAAGAMTGSLGIARAAHAAGSDEIKLALVGCGNRGTGAALQALSNASHRNVKLVAMADAFRDRVDKSLSIMRRRVGQKIDVPEDRIFVGLDCYEKAIQCDVDMVLLCSPPGFRPQQYEAAVAAGRHVFMEKPLATDVPGIRRIMATNEQAKKKRLAVAVGHHLRHEDKHRDTIKRIHDGAIGPVQFLRVYFMSNGVWVRPRLPEQNEMQYQVSNWYYFTWLSGDHIVEQHVHDLDVGNWIMKESHPVEAQGMGGRQVRKGPDYGEIFDHHAVEFTYADGTKMFSQCRHIPGCYQSFSHHAHGAAGTVDIQGLGSSVMRIRGQKPKRWRRTADGHQIEMDELFAALATGRPYHEGDWAAVATMTALLGRMATYSGQVVQWDEAIQSDLNLAPKQFTWDAEPPVRPGPDGIYACAVPGITKPW